MKELNPYLDVFFNSDVGKVSIGKIGWDGNKMVADGINERHQERIQDMWNEIEKYDADKISGLNPVETLDYIWRHFNSATYYTFGKPPEDKKNEPEMVR